MIVLQDVCKEYPGGIKALDSISIEIPEREFAFLVGPSDLSLTIRRLVAYGEAGADCLYAPGIRQPEQLAEIVHAVAPKPVNALVGGDYTSVARLAQIGVRRISVGGALARTAWTAFLAAAREIAGAGTFHTFAATIPHTELNELFQRR